MFPEDAVPMFVRPLSRLLPIIAACCFSPATQAPTACYQSLQETVGACVAGERTLAFPKKASDPLKARLVLAGFKVVEVGLSEFLKAGGSAKCLTLKLIEPVR